MIDMKRREFGIASIAALLCSTGMLSGCSTTGALQNSNVARQNTKWVFEAEKERILRNAKIWFIHKVETITAFSAARSPGDKHAYYSEADYWWPDPANPKGPYIRRDGLTNPNRFDDHRQALITMSRAVPSLVVAWKQTNERRYAEQAIRHMHAWFVDPDTKMAPHLDHAQAIIGVNTGRGTGIIDTLHLAEVAQAAHILAPVFPTEIAPIRDWFVQYIDWMMLSANGKDEGDELNNHGTTYVVQVAAFARLTGDSVRNNWCVNQLQNILIPAQVEPDGSQPLELKRTKPFGYCLFNLDALATAAHILSTPKNNIWAFSTPDGRSIPKALAYMAPFIADKKLWPHQKDVAYWDEWPVRHPALLFGGIALSEDKYTDLWRTLDADPQTPEIIRNFPIRQPSLWV
jgi:hypothetical protein